MTANAYYDITASHTTAQAELGDEINVNGARYKYVQAKGALTAYDLSIITVSTAGVVEAAPATTTLAGGTSSVLPSSYCIPQFAVADDEYFWAPIGPFGATFTRGAFKVNAAITCLSSVKLYSTGTAGVVDDTSTNTVLIQGLVLLAGAGDAAAACQCIATRRLASNS